MPAEKGLQVSEGTLELAERALDLTKLGLFDFNRLQEASQGMEDEVIERIIKARSLNVAIGDSGIGKTALAVQMGVCVASGKEFLGFPVTTSGRVLYCDAESGMGDFLTILDSVSSFLGLAEPPSDFIIANPYWVESPSDIAEYLITKIRAVTPTLVIVDPLRPFWPEAVDKGSDTATVVGRLRKIAQETGCSFVLLHHIRKRDRKGPRVTLEDGLAFFEEAAGARAIINSTDTRIGVEAAANQADLNVAGFTRIVGWFGPFSIAREHDEDGKPIGYSLLKGEAFLNERYRGVFNKLSDEFRFADVKRVGEMGSSSATALLSQAQKLGLVERNGTGYRKLACAGQLD